MLMDADLPQHPVARTRQEQALTGARVGLPWESLTAFQRIVTNPRISPRPLTATQAWSQVEEWLALPTVWTPVPGPDHGEILGRLIA